MSKGTSFLSFFFCTVVHSSIHSLYIYLLPISDDVHDLKNELEETRSAYRNRKADVIALQTELNTANDNIMNMTRVVDDFKHAIPILPDSNSMTKEMQPSDTCAINQEPQEITNINGEDNANEKLADLDDDNQGVPSIESLELIINENRIEIDSLQRQKARFEGI
jgi:chromosome segregation ATPase